MGFKKETKGQAGIIIVISILIFILVLLFVIVTINKNSEEDTSYEKSLDFNVYRNSVVNCLNQKLENALLLATRQGGYIYKGIQPGKTPNLFIHYKTFFVPYYIRSMTPLEPTRIVYERVEGFPFNCSEPYDKNHNNITNYKDDCIPSYQMNSLVQIPSFGSIISDDVSISERIAENLEENIRTYLLNKAEECIIEENDVFQLLDRKTDELNVSVFINKYDIEAHIHYPVTVRKKGSAETKTFEDFKARIDGRFGDLFKLVEEVIYNETHFANYEPHYSNNGFEVKVYRFSSGNDIIEIADNKTIIYGESLKFWFGRKNRPPLIYEMPNVPDDSDVKFMINFSWYYPFNETLNEILTSPYCNENELRSNLSYFFYNLTGFIKAIDPDQDKLIYTDNIKDYKCISLKDYKCISQLPYFNYNVSDGNYTVEVYVALDWGS